MDGGYKHAEFKFSSPLQISIREPASVDVKFIGALNAAHSASSTVIERLRLRFSSLNSRTPMMNS